MQMHVALVLKKIIRICEDSHVKGTLIRILPLKTCLLFQSPFCLSAPFGTGEINCLVPAAHSQNKTVVHFIH